MSRNRATFFFYCLVVWNMWIIFPYIGNVIIPTDFKSIIFHRGKYTTNQFIINLFTSTLFLGFSQELWGLKQGHPTNLSFLNGFADLRREAYREKALKWHPDKNPENREESLYELGRHCHGTGFSWKDISMYCISLLII